MTWTQKKMQRYDSRKQAKKITKAFLIFFLSHLRLSISTYFFAVVNDNFFVKSSYTRISFASLL
jgi:hypothetical protein